MTDNEIIKIAKQCGYENIEWESTDGTAFLAGWRACERQQELNKEGRRDVYDIHEKH
jgi:hypothetical protein